MLCKETGVMALAIVALWSLRHSSIKKGTSWQTAAKYFLVVSHGQSLLDSDQNILFPILTENLRTGERQFE